MKLKSVLTMAAMIFFVAANAQTADEIIAKYHENTGGVDKWKALKTMKVNGKMTMQGMDLSFSMTTKIPNKQFMKISVQGQEIIQAYDGKDAWAINPFASGKEPVKLTPEQSKEMTDRKMEDEFIDYKKKGHEVKLLGKEVVDGTSCYKIELVKNKFNDEEDVTEIFYFDAENYVPIMTASFVRSGPMKGQESKTYMSDYQDVNGLMMPFATETKMNGQTLQKMTFEKVLLNESVDDTTFAYPKK